jgi:hypothetical protein
MKLALLAAVAASLLAGCKDRPREATPTPGSASGARSAAPSPTPAAPATTATGSAAGSAGGSAEPLVPDICKSSLGVLDRAACKTPEASQGLLQARIGLERLGSTIGLGGSDPRQYQVMCAEMLLAIEQDATKLGCKLPIDAAQRKEIDGLLEWWYGQRTPVTPTGDAASDAVIAKIVAVRDATCQCRDAACLDRVQQQLVAIGTLPQAAPDAARTLGRKLLDDTGRCAARVRLIEISKR